MAVRDALNAALDEELERDPKVILLGEDIGRFGGLEQVRKISA
jgi:pyruvate dehydrogenase E1 component beta subunit